MDIVINIRTKKKVRDDAKKIFAKMGLSTSAAINMFLRNVVAEQRLPFTPSARLKNQTKDNELKNTAAPEKERPADSKKNLFKNFWK